MRASPFVAAAFAAFAAFAPAALAATSANVSLPAVVEFDLIFPRNETYALSPTFPFIFAMQNAELVSYMGSTGPNVQVRVRREDDYSATLTNFRPHLNYSKSNDDTKSGNENGVYFVYEDMRSAILSNGTWVIAWDVTMPNCSRDPKGSSEINGGVTGNSQPRYTTFTISADGKQPDFETPKDQGGECFHSQDEDRTSAGFNITDILSLEGQYGKARDFLSGMDNCLVTANDTSLPKTNPCAAKVDSDSASSMSAALLATACSKPTSLASCPPKNAAPRALPTAGVVAGIILAGFAILI
ncbi:hypothetical protein ISF_08920 [Cordyceps fumosorosea ARSEF 2679]|uniref:DUF7136 domain-containing protein n=1 Tax=Cordyceps fumosorosea (strain ARSEF 2679) TaxID=1081104 RepID=A0A162K4E9_CORFA|nr:hypothetical protein ISF_08920 [Cordyceps fumosorosea ARSEF 2679]OAA53188.1 hypothetical protein ISF_08920 [Cordyceps fumosorosea ARSEF 2679]